MITWITTSSVHLTPFVIPVRDENAFDPHSKTGREVNSGKIYRILYTKTGTGHKSTLKSVKSMDHVNFRPEIL